MGVESNSLLHRFRFFFLCSANGVFGKAHLRALSRRVSSNVHSVQFPVNATRQPITPASFHSTPLSTHTVLLQLSCFSITGCCGVYNWFCFTDNPNSLIIENRFGRSPSHPEVIFAPDYVNPVLLAGMRDHFKMGGKDVVSFYTLC